MLSDFKNFGIKKWIAAILVMLFITDILIIFNVPFLREIFAFLYFTLVPGILILNILRLNKLEFIKKVVLTVGLSVSLLIFSGLLLNNLYPLLLKPLSLVPVLILLNLLLIIMSLVAYYRNRNDFILGEFLNFDLNLKGKLSSMLLLPVIFPFMAIFGTYLMNTSENNIILLTMLFLIPVYIVLVAIFKNKIHNANYPVAIFTISLSILLMYGLTSQFIMGRDINMEFICFQLALNNFHWNINDYLNPFNACLSVTILPIIYKVLTNISDQYVFKLIFAIIGAFIPLLIYIVSKKYINNFYAFFASVLFIFQLFFINLLGAVRQEIAILFFFLAIMVIFSIDITKNSRKILFLVLFASLLVSHYTTAYVAFILFITILMVPFLKNLIIKRKITFTNFDIILISIILIILWYVLYAKVQFVAVSQVAQVTLSSAAGAGNVTKGSYVLGILGIELKSLSNTISVIAHNLIFATIIVGIAGIIWKFKYYRKIFETEFFVGIFLSLVILILFILLPYISIAYDASRLFFQLLIFLAPVFIIGAITIAKFIRKPKWDIAIILILLIFLFSCTTYLQYHFLGMPYSATYDPDGTVRGEQYIYESEVAGAYWLKNYEIDNSSVYCDDRARNRFIMAEYRNPNINSTFFQVNKRVNSGYIYLGKVNIDKRQIYLIYEDTIILNLDDYSNLFRGKQKVYDSGGGQIWT
jgi:uncharacterized membrane protein